MGLERFVPKTPDRPLSEHVVKSGDAFVRLHTGNLRITGFAPLQPGDHRAAELDHQSETVFMPFGSVAGVEVADEEYLLKHLRRKEGKPFGIILVAYGDGIRHITDHGNDFYRLDGTETLMLTSREFAGDIGPLSVSGHFVRRRR